MDNKPPGTAAPGNGRDDRFSRIDQIYHQALERPEEERRAYLAQACADDDALRREVEELLSFDKKAGSFIESPALDLAAHALARKAEQGKKINLVGQTILHYKVQEKIGEGGMGIVYKALDTHLQRPVAIKVLPPEIVADRERRRRFVQEARAASALNHPNIVHVYDIDQTEGTDFIAMEYVSGKTLDDLIPRRGIRLSLALKYAIQITDALARSHAAGIIHRDLKPSNVMVDDHGLVKVLDFGLAKLTEVSGPEAETVSARTGEGTILGTTAYMSPEQAEAKPIDTRSDIFSFGSMFYEMLTGQRPFRGDTRASTIASILREEPEPISQVAEGLPREAERIVKRCLRKDPEHRFHHMEDLRVALEDLKEESDSGVLEAAAGPGATARGKLWWTGVLAGVSVIAATLAVAGWYWMRPVSEPVLSKRLTITLPAEAPLASPLAMSTVAGDKPALALSPDGARLAYVAQMGDQTQVCICDMTTGSWKALPGTTGGHTPFFSPDGASIAFFDKTSLKTLTPGGGQPVSLAEVTNPCGGTWGTDDFIYFNRGDQEGLVRIPSRGGPVKIISQEQLWMPEFLGVGHGLLAYSAGSLVWIKDDHVIRKLVEGFAARYVRPGYLVYGFRGKLMAVPFDRSRGEITGEAVTLADDLRTASYGTAQFTVSQDGTIAYVHGHDQVLASFVWVDRQGNRTQVGLPENGYGPFSLSPDGSRVAVQLRGETVGAGSDIWIYDLSNGSRSRLTPRSTSGHSFEHSFPRWTPDGRHVLYWRYVSETQGQLVSAAADRNAENVVLWSSVGHGPRWLYPMSFSPDGSVLAAFGRCLNSSDDLYLIRLNAPEPKLFLGSPFVEVFGQIAPDGRSMAYASDESGQMEIWVTTYPEPGPRCQVTKNGGMDPTWNPNGREIVYQWGPAMFAIDVLSVPHCRVGAPRLLFRGAFPDRWGFGHDMTSDGQKFLMLEKEDYFNPSATLKVITNVSSELQRRTKK